MNRTEAPANALRLASLAAGMLGANFCPFLSELPLSTSSRVVAKLNTEYGSGQGLIVVSMVIW